MEIYNEQVFDLLNHTGKPMKVRNHKVLGPYVDGLAEKAASDIDAVIGSKNHIKCIARDINNWVIVVII